MTTKNSYFANLAARLDPAAISILSSPSGFNVDVPEGEVWWLLGAHWVCGWQPGTGNVYVPWEHRCLDHRKARPLPGGTKLQASNLEGSSLGTAFAVICRPKLAWDADDRYSADPEELYYQRLMTITALAPIFTGAIVPANSPNGSNASSPMNWGGSDADHFVTMSVQNERCSWINIAGSTADGGWFGLNCMPEISDHHATSVDEPCITILPRKRLGQLGFDNLWLAAGNSAGNLTDGNDRPSYGLMTWAPLPSDF